MTTTTQLTLYLAQAMGFYLILIGLSGLIRPARWRQMLDEFAASAALPLVTGIFTLALGLTLIYLHSIFTDPLAVAVSLVGWIALVKGALLIVVPQMMTGIGSWSPGFIRIWAVAVILMGIALGLAGLLGRVDAGAIIA